VLCTNLADLAKQILKLPWKKTPLVSAVALLFAIIQALDCKCLTRAGLSIGKDRTIVPLEARINHWLAYLFEQLILGHPFISNEIKRELLCIFGVEHDDLAVDDFLDAASLVNIS